MKTRTLIWGAAVLLTLAWGPTGAQDQIPESSGFGGYIMTGGAHFSFASNMLVGGSPMVRTDVGEPRIESILDAPPTTSAPGVLVGGELNYTFSSTRTQLFLGNRLEDLLRLDLVVGLGVRQEIGSAGILAASALITPKDLKFWSDPYVEGEDRVATDLDFPGFRLRWGEIFGTGLELTITDRFYNFDEENSGDWLVSEDRLDPEEQPLLNRDGDILRIQALYRFDVKKTHRFEPAVRWVDDAHKGAAVANRGYSLQLTYLYFSKKVILDANLIVGAREADEINPIYGKRLESERRAASLTAYIPVKRFKKSVLNVFVGGEVFDEDTNIDFYDSSLSMAMAGILWRPVKK
jgi:hypothetical protein